MRHVKFSPEETGILYAISSGLLEGDEPKVFSSLAELIGEELNLAGCSIWRQQPGAPGPERLGYYERQGEVILDYLPNLDYQVAHRVTESGEMLVDNNIGTSAGFKAGILCPGLMALPLIMDDKPGGALCLWVEESSKGDTVSLNMAREMAQLLAGGLRLRRNSRHGRQNEAGSAENMEKEYNLPGTAYRRGQVMPGMSLDIRSVEINDRSGDFYDFTTGGDNNLAVMLGTMLGKGDAVLPWRHGVRLLLKLLARRNTAPARACAELGEMLYDELHSTGFLMSLLYARYNPLNGSFSYCNAGCNPPVIFCGKPEKDTSAGSSQPLIGLTEYPAYAEKSLYLKSGDIAVLYSNGAAEIMNNEGAVYSRARIFETIRKYHYYNASSLLDCLMLDIHRFLGGRQLLEHVTLAVIKAE